MNGISLSILRKLVIGAGIVAVPAASFGSVFISVNFAPPPLPIYTQPLCPGQGYLWTPGYWAYDDYEGGYFWVPGTWVQPPTIGYLWTPGYWGYGESAYFFHPGYWGPHIGFYGGVNYGFGYIGHGYEGGYWEGNRFNYNRSVNNVNVTNIRNTYVKNVTVVNNYNNVSYNGGQGGVQARALPQEVRAQREQHIQPTADQRQHQQLAATNKAQFATVNGGRPAVISTRTPEEFKQTVQRGGLGSLPNTGSVNGGARTGAIAAGNARTMGAARDARVTSGVQSQARGATPVVPSQPTPGAQRPMYQAPAQTARPQVLQGQAPIQRSAPQATYAPQATQPQRPMYQAPAQGNRPQPQSQSQPRAQYQPPSARPEYQQARPQAAQPQPRPQMQMERPAPAQRQEQAPRQEQHGGGNGRPQR